MSGITEAQGLNAAHIGRRVRLVYGDSILVGPLNRIAVEPEAPFSLAPLCRWPMSGCGCTGAAGPSRTRIDAVEIELQIGDFTIAPSPYAAIELLDEDD